MGTEKWNAVKRGLIERYKKKWLHIKISAQLTLLFSRHFFNSSKKDNTY